MAYARKVRGKPVRQLMHTRQSVRAAGCRTRARAPRHEVLCTHRPSGVVPCVQPGGTARRPGTPVSGASRAKRCALKRARGARGGPRVHWSAADAPTTDALTGAADTVAVAATVAATGAPA